MMFRSVLRHLDPLGGLARLANRFDFPSNPLRTLVVDYFVRRFSISPFANRQGRLTLEVLEEGLDQQRWLLDNLRGTVHHEVPYHTLWRRFAFERAHETIGQLQRLHERSTTEIGYLRTRFLGLGEKDLDSAESVLVGFFTYARGLLQRADWVHVIDTGGMIRRRRGFVAAYPQFGLHTRQKARLRM